MTTETCAAARAIEELLGFARLSGLIFREDVPFCRNLLLDILKLEEPAAGYDIYEPCESEPQETAAKYLDVLCDFAAQAGVIEDYSRAKELLSARLMGAVTLPPSTLLLLFNQKKSALGAKAATDWFYDYSRKCNYVQIDAIKRNIEFTADSDYGELLITINLSRPESDPKSIAAMAGQKQSGYPVCLLCVENPGHAGNLLRPARQNHRMLPVTLNGEAWHMQYSPYLYYSEHCIALCDKHIPMVIDRATFVRLLDFVDHLPHYFMGSNADLPIVCGSIMGHLHFQGGNYLFPMDKAPDEITLDTGKDDVTAALIRWPVTCIRAKSKNREALTEFSNDILGFWRNYSDSTVGIISRTTAQHNTITPIARIDVDGSYVMNLALRNNRTDAEHPSGIFHPRESYHNIKRENIGLIEVMGMFILAGRLKDELDAARRIICGERETTACPDLHRTWVERIISTIGIASTSDSEQIIREEVAKVCANVLEDVGVFKATPEGRTAFMRFWEAFRHRD